LKATVEGTHINKTVANPHKAQLILYDTLHETLGATYVFAEAQ